MSEVIDFEEDILEEAEMGSLYHSTTQARITTLLGSEERFQVMVELSLDASQIDLNQFGVKAKDELKPDISVYIKQLPTQTGKKLKLDADMMKVAKMPVLAIEILSPNQTINELLRRIEALFALGIKSCWLVIPALEEIRVYGQDFAYKTFDTQRDTDVIDDALDISLPIQKIFEDFEW
jgi:Uma2 family endonuclease